MGQDKLILEDRECKDGKVKRNRSNASDNSFFGVFAIFGSISLYIAFEGACFGYKSQNWPSTQGIIDESSIRTRLKKKGRTRHSPRIRYHYSVADMSYNNDKVQFLQNMFYPKSKKQEIISRFRSGQETTIYYNPSNPEQSVLITGFPIVSFPGGMLIGLLFCSLGIYGLLLLGK